MAKQLIILKTYGGAEGVRVKPGTIFTINGSGDPGTISDTRATQLRKRNLGEDFDPKVHGQENLRRPQPQAKVEPDSAPPETKLDVRAQARRRTKNADSPKEPQRLDNGQSRDGGPTGLVKPPSLSREAPALQNKTLASRGDRKDLPGSRSTPASDSPPGQTSSTPVTEPGGANTTTNSTNTEVID